MSWWQSFLDGVRAFFRHDHAQQSGVTLEHSPNPGSVPLPSVPVSVETVAVSPKASSPPVVQSAPPTPAPIQVVQTTPAGVDWGGLIKTGIGAVSTGVRLFANNDQGSAKGWLGSDSESANSDSSPFESSDSEFSDSEGSNYDSETQDVESYADSTSGSEAGD